MKVLAGLSLGLALGSSGLMAADYVIDGTGEGMHAAVQFKASHIGISALWGRFNDVRGHFSYDADNMADSHIEVFIDVNSLDSNHRERDIHLRSDDYLSADTYPEAHFVSRHFEVTGEGQARVTGDLSLHGVTREVVLDVTRTGEGETPFGDYRVGFEATGVLRMDDFNITPTSPEVELFLAIEGVRQ